MSEKKQQETGDRQRATGNGQARQISRRGLFGALAGVVAAVVASVGRERRERREKVVEQRRRRRFWIGHT